LQKDSLNGGSFCISWPGAEWTASHVCHRFAPRLNSENTPEYAAFRKLQVYEAATSEALHEGGISEKERSLLVRLRDSLGISASDADAIEVELQKRLPSFA
jgi:hypothetical protein